MKPALQTMCINETIESEGMRAALRKAAEIGYDEIEISGHIDLTDEAISECMSACQEYGLHVCALSCEYSGPFSKASYFPGQRSLHLTREGFAECVQTAEKMNCDILRFAGLPVEFFHSEDDLRSYFYETEECCRKLQKNGLRLCAHNHVGEFARLNGKTFFEWALELAPDLNFEMDLFGVQMSGTSPLDFLSQARGRVPLLHASDISIVVTEDPRFSLNNLQRVPIGMGNFNMKAILKTAEECGTEYCIMEASQLKEISSYDAMSEALSCYRECVQ